MASDFQSFRMDYAHIGDVDVYLVATVEVVTR